MKLKINQSCWSEAYGITELFETGLQNPKSKIPISFINTANPKVYA